MIDCDKIKEAESLLQKGQWLTIDVSLWASDDSGGDIIFHCNNKNLDKLINTLKELANPKPKYKKNEAVWFVTDGSIINCFVIDCIDFLNGTYFYNTDLDHGFSSVAEEDLFPTKEKLIDAQIKYWISQKDNLVKRTVTKYRIEK